MKPTMNKQIVQMASGQFPKILFLTTLSNHYDILGRCRSFEERLFYILYAHKERLSHKELQRAITTQTYETLLSDKNNMSKGLLETYPNSPIMFKDTYFIDFLNLPKRHSEKRLKNGLLEHMKQFILELGKDFIFMDQEYCLNVGASSFKADLLFFHRGLQALVAVELKKTKFHPRDLGQLEFYLEALDRDVKRSNENPSIGIILCPDADKVVVKYAMSRSTSPTMVAEYKRILISQKKIQQQLREFCQFFLKEDKSQKNERKSVFCTVPSLIFWPDRSDISSAILLNGIHCTTSRYVTSARRFSPYLIRQLGASQLFTQPHSQTFS